jgi:hypothetical protein
MHITFTLIIQIIAVVCLIFAAFRLFQNQPPPNQRPEWGWLGMALWLFSLIVSGIEIHATGGS